MGSFLLALEEDKEVINDVYNERGQDMSFEFTNDIFNFKKFKKSLLKNDPFIFEFDDGFIIGRGTISYKSFSTLKGFEKLVIDLQNKKLDKNELYGHFSIIHFSTKCNKLDVYFDESTYCAPYVIDNKFISSSFLSCVENINKLSLNTEAIFEQIYTGCYFNGKTTFSEIRKIIGPETWRIKNLTINFIPIVNNEISEAFNTKKDAISGSIKTLDKYFQRWIPQVNEYKADLGLSSGYDSRLMLSFMENAFESDYQVHSYWKKNLDFDNVVANKLANAVGKSLVSISISDRDLMTEKEFDSMLYKAMIYYDGLYPSNHGWVREYRTKEYRTKVLRESKFGFSGLSGEQYRNEFNLLDKSYKISYLINDIILENNNHEILKESSYKNKGFNIIKESVIQSLNLKKDTVKISRIDMQRMYCEMWVVGGPGVRNQVENNLSFFLSPFTERYIQNKAYQNIKFLGLGGRFQSKMITLLNIKLASIISDYGFSFNNVSFKHDVLAFTSTLLKRKSKIKLASYIKPISTNYIETFGKHKSIVEEKIGYLNQFNFPFPIEISKFQQDTIDRLIALSKLLQHYKSKL